MGFKRMRKRFIHIALCLTMTLFILLIPGTVRANTFGIEFEFSFERAFSFTQYQIGGRYTGSGGISSETFFPISQLRFPLNIYSLSGKTRLTILDTFMVTAKLGYNINSYGGKMEDSDWMYDNILTTYSESDAHLKAATFDCDLSYNLLMSQSFSLWGGAGFFYQRFIFQISDLIQWQSIAPNFGTSLGPVISYETNSYIPYLFIFGQVSPFSWLKINIKFAISPLAFSNDIDDHLLRSKLSKSDSKGSAFFLDLSLRFYIFDFLYTHVTCSYLYASMEGEQRQLRYTTTVEGPPGPVAIIENRIDSQQFNLSCGAGLSFDW